MHTFGVTLLQQAAAAQRVCAAARKPLPSDSIGEAAPARQLQCAPGLDGGQLRVGLAQAQELLVRLRAAQYRLHVSHRLPQQQQDFRHTTLCMHALPT